MGTKYSSVSISGYNSSPPSDDASQTEANKVKWSTIKTKLPDPLKTGIEAINSALVAALDQSVRSVSTADSTIAGDHNKTIQIASTVTASITISLMDAATAAAGYIVNVSNQSAVSCLVDRVTASNTINGVTSSISIMPLESIQFIVNSATNGYIAKRSTTRLPRRASSSTETLVAADMGKLVVTITASTLTLPLLSAVVDGDVIGFQLNAAVAVTVQRQSTDELSWNGLATLNSVKLTQFGDYLFLVADKTDSRWRVLSEHIQGPYFRAQYEGAGQSIGTNTVTKLQFNTEISDSHGYYDPTTNFRFTPLIPGWYQVSATAYISGAAASRSAVIIHKNGVEFAYGQRSYSTNDGTYTVSFPVYFNGTTDYVEIYGVCVDAAGTFDDALESNFTAVRIR